MNPDIIVFGPTGANGQNGTPGLPASVDFTNGPAAQGGTCTKGNCVCASNGTSGGAGNSGNTGSAGLPPPKAPTLCVIVGRLLSDLIVHTQAGNGGNGGAGGNGSNGGAGQNAGINASSCLKKGWFEPAPCQPAIGGYGGNAGRGASGMPGGDGGDGGDIYIYYGEKQGVDGGGAAYQVFGQSIPGGVGMGGAPGQPGLPGAGGFNEPVGGNAATQQGSGYTAQAGGWGPNGSLPGTPGAVFSKSLPQS